MNREMVTTSIPWLREIPKEWAVERCKYNFSYHKDVAKEQASNYDRLALTMKGVIKRPKDDLNGLQPKDFEGYQIVNKGDLVFKLIDLAGVSTSRVGLSCYEGLVSPAYILLHANEDKMNAQYATYFFLSMWYQLIFNEIGNGGIRSSLNAGDLLEVPIIRPHISEQLAIVKFLDAKCAAIDEAIDRHKKIIEKLEEYRRSTIANLVSFKDYDDTYNTNNIWFPLLPFNIGLSRVGLHFSITLGKMLCSQPKDDNDTLEPYYCAGDVHFNGINNTQLKKMWFSSKDKEQYEVQNGDMLIVEGGAGAGNSYIVSNQTSPVYIQNSILRIRPSKTGSIRYLRYLMEHLVTNGYILYACNTATFSHFTKDKVSCVPFPVASVELQEEIADKIDVIDKMVQKKCHQINNIIVKLEEYRKSIIYNAVTGKIECREGIK